ncbi:hypothetical protein ACFU5O_36740 [Streptomyces sp. NPDC057445]|uniref:hypothetical protein n=1 Tax=Streptomyces sp. NPDC057445 TaxID=3346136 RepID=UPI003677E916
MSADGSWEFTIDSPIGKQSLWVDLKSEGEALTGKCRANGQVIDPDIRDGKVDGDLVSFKVKSLKPVPLTMKLTLTRNGDTMTGKAKPGMFGTFPVTGKRV